MAGYESAGYVSPDEEEPLLANNGYKYRHGSLDDSQFSESDMSISSGSFMIEDIATTDALNRCNRLINGYKICLKVIGWHSFVENPSLNMKLARGLWMSAIFLFIVFALSAQAMSCFRRDLFDWINATNNDLCGEGSDIHKLIRCDISFVSVFVIPALLLMITYIYGIYLFWGTNEYLDNLAGQVFIHSKDLGHPEKYVVKKIILYFCLALLYIVASLIVRVFHSIVFKMFKADVAICWTDFGHMITGSEKYFLLITSLIGFLFFDGIYVTAVMNYVVQSELNISLLNYICLKLENGRYEHLDVAIKDIGMAYSNIMVLNGKIATAVALILFNFVSSALQGVISLGDAVQEDTQSVAVITMSAALWCFLTVFPFVQAIRVTSACTDLLDVSSVIRARPMIYKNAHREDLDSFCIFTTSITNMRAEIFGIPLYPWIGYVTATSIAFVMLILCQRKIYQYAEWL